MYNAEFSRDECLYGMSRPTAIIDIPMCQASMEVLGNRKKGLGNAKATEFWTVYSIITNVSTGIYWMFCGTSWDNS